MNSLGAPASPLHPWLQRTVDALPHGMLLIGIDHAVQVVNTAFTALTGWSAELTCHRPVDAHDGPFRDGVLTMALAQSLALIKPVTVEGWCYRRSGVPFWSEVSLAPVPGDDGQVAFVSAELRDIDQRRLAQEDGRRKDKRYRDLIEHIPAGVVVHGAGSEILLANQEAARLLGLSMEQLRGRVAIDPRWHFQHEDGTPFALSEYPVNRVLVSKAALRQLVIGIQRPGETDPVWVMCNAFPVLDDDGELHEVVVSFTDVTGLKNVERALHASEERLQLVLRGSNDAPWDWDMVQNTLYYSPRWWHMLGYAVDELPADAGLWMRLLHPDDRPKMEALVQRAYTDSFESYEMEFRLRHKAGHYVPMLSRGFLLRDAQGRPLRVSGTNQDVSERKKAEEQIHHLAFYDALTDLPNRRFLVEQLRKALLNSARNQMHGALLFIDLDHFKELNDTQGHDTGDALLRMVARRLCACVREADTVARLGGDEFVVMLESLHPHAADAAIEAERIGQKMVDALNQPYPLDGQTYHGTPSIGIALFDQTCEGIETLLKHADLAMYQAKAAGRNTMRFFDDSMQAAVDERVALEAALRDALAQEQLQLHYQPQVDARGQVIGAEALVRWAHPQRGLVSPAAFIPLAESTGLILPLGRWVLRQACLTLSRWAQTPGLSSLSLAVNVSAHQFHDPHFADDVGRALAETGAPAHALKLELTESVLATHLGSVTATMAQLQGQGVGFALDDFGTGYSSLAYLKHLPLDQLKIDASFVRDVLTDPSDATLVRIIITLAREMGLSAIAEGVETAEQHAFLAAEGCRLYQGYLFGRPVPLATLEAQVLSRLPAADAHSSNTHHRPHAGD